MALLEIGLNLKLLLTITILIQKEVKGITQTYQTGINQTGIEKTGFNDTGTGNSMSVRGFSFLVFYLKSIA